jgi:hypothetical protein
MDKNEDKYEEYNYEDYSAGHGGKGRSKIESAQHHQKDSSHKAPAIIANAEDKRKKEALQKQKDSYIFEIVKYQGIWC